MNVGPNIKHYREERGLTADQLGEITGFGWARIQHLESGALAPYWLDVLAIARVLGVPSKELLA